MPSSVVCWGCGREKRRNAPHPSNPHDRTSPHGWDTVAVVAPERWWELKFLVCSPACKATVHEKLQALQDHVRALHQVQSAGPNKQGVQDAEFWEDE